MDDNRNIQKAYEAILNHDFEQAIDWFEKAIAEEPDNASYHYRLSISYARSNKLTKAVEHAEAACRLDPAAEAYSMHMNTVIARQLLHKADDRLRDAGSTGADEAIYLLKRAVRLDPLSAEALLMLAIAYSQSGKLRESLNAASEALKLDPEHKEVHQFMKQLLQQINRVD